VAASSRGHAAGGMFQSGCFVFARTQGAEPPLDKMGLWWEISHMQSSLVKADAKNRVPIRGTKKGQQYLVTAENGGWWIIPAPKVKTPTREMEGVVADTWNKLGPAPEIDYDKI